MVIGKEKTVIDWTEKIRAERRFQINQEEINEKGRMDREIKNKIMLPVDPFKA